MKLKKLTPTLFIVSLAFLARPFAATFSGTAETDDATVFSDQPTGNAGAATECRSGRNGTGAYRRFLIWFDLSTIPANATVSSASLDLTLTSAPVGGPASTNQKLCLLTNSWVEGTGTDLNGLNVVTGAVSWNSRMEGSVTWTSAGGDFITTPTATLSVTKSIGGVYTWSGAGVANDVQSWIATGGTNNFGWILIGDEAVSQSIRGYATSEATSGVPVLTVTYTTPTATPTPSPTRSPTPSPTATITPTPTDTPTSTPSPTGTPTATITDTTTPTPSMTPTPSPTDTPTPTHNSTRNWDLYE